MKEKLYKILIAAFLMQIVSTSGFGLPVDSLRIKLDHVFEHIDKSQVPTGFLEEYGAQFVNLNRFNGILTDSNEVNALGWQYIYATVYSSRIYGTNTLPTPEANYTTFNNAAKANKGVNPVSMLALSYSRLKPDALTNNLFTIINEQLYDVPGRSQSPYQQNIAFAAAPFYETDADGELQLLFKQSLFMNNTGKTVSSIKVDFGNGTGFVTASWDNALTGTYLDTGLKKLTIQLTFTDATALKCYSSVRILKASAGSRLMSYEPTDQIRPFNPTGNNHNGGDVTVRYSVNNTTPTDDRKFQKPFIVVEGFDMHDAAPLLMEKGYDYESFRREITNVAFSSSGVYNTFNYNLDDIGGYDLIFLNYRDGTDDILRNALLLQEVIAWVNGNKAPGADQNVVMGISMGGLVSRYCLAKMTKDGIPTQTRLLITHDSPHRGANIPLGAQYAINDFLNMRLLGRTMVEWIPQLQQVIHLQTRPATVQQLIVRYDPLTSKVENNTFLAPNGPYQEMVTFKLGDKKPKYKLIATSQGSQCGEPVMAPYTSLAKTSGEAAFHIGFGSFGTKFYGKAEINALPNQEPKKPIARFTLSIRNKIFWIGFSKKLIDYEKDSPANILGFDGAPGGTLSTSRGSGFTGVTPSWGSGPWFIPPFIFEWVFKFSGVQIAPEFTFLPTASALDLELNESNLLSPHVGANYTLPTDNTLLQSYIAQEPVPSGAMNISNIEHTEFTARNSSWIFAHMQGNDFQTTCDDFCEQPGIEGSDYFCSSTSSDYTLQNLPSTSSVAWTVTPITGGATANSPNYDRTELTKISDGWITLKATITDARCGITEPTKNISIGTPALGVLSFSNSANEDAVWCSSHTGNTFSHDNYPLSDITGYQSRLLSYPSMSVVNVANYAHPESPDPHGYVPQGWYLFELKASNACGTSDWVGTEIESIDCSILFFRLTVSPNPAKGIVRLNISDEASRVKSIGSQAPVTIELHTLQTAVKKKQWRFTNNRSTFELDVSDMEKGMYLITVRKGKWSQSTKLIIE